MSDLHRDVTYEAALNTAAELLGTRLEPAVVPGPGEPSNAGDFTRLATVHTFGEAWPRTDATTGGGHWLLRCRIRYLGAVDASAEGAVVGQTRGQRGSRE